MRAAHPGLAAALRRDAKWTQVSDALCGQKKTRCLTSMAASHARQVKIGTGKAGYGRHFRAAQAFRYLLEPQRLVGFEFK